MSAVHTIAPRTELHGNMGSIHGCNLEGCENLQIHLKERSRTQIRILRAKRTQVEIGVIDGIAQPAKLQCDIDILRARVLVVPRIPRSGSHRLRVWYLGVDGLSDGGWDADEGRACVDGDLRCALRS